jgi:polysaccharide export outer membrane protein
MQFCGGFVANGRRGSLGFVLAVIALGGTGLNSVAFGAHTPQQAGNPQQDPSSPAKQTDAKQSPDTTAAKPQAASIPLPTDYRVGAEDELTISVWHEPEFSQAVVVRPDGMITLPLINEIKVSGLTTEEMQALLTEKLKTVVNDPQVTVIVKAVKSRKIFLVGNVIKQGVYPLGGRKTALEAIAEAGGLGPFAKTGSIYVLRKENGKEIKIPFNYKKALSGKGANPELMPGDMVVVP